MKMILALNVAIAAAVAASDCGSLSVQRYSCGNGTVASPVDIKACSSQLCADMSMWELAHGTEPGMVLKGRGWGCVYEATNLVVSSVVCVNGTSPKPKPNPACSKLSVQWSGSCGSGTLASPADIKTCSRDLCNEMGNWEMAHGTDTGMVLKGTGYGCVYEAADEVVAPVICVNATSPKPTPTPVPCSWLSVQWPASCGSGAVASPVDIKACSSQLCAELPEWGYAHGTEPGMVLKGRGYGCVYEATKYFFTSIVCINATSPVCSKLSVQDDTCKSGTVATTVDIQSCKHQLCAEMSMWRMAHGTDTGMVLKGRGYGCVYERSDDPVSSVICTNGTSPKPKPEPVPCGRLSVYDGTCSSGTLASSADIKACSRQLCAAMDKWAMAHGTDTGMVLKGDGYGCVYEATDEVVNFVICIV